jgi:dihydroflavonol-4-reductase
VNRGRAFVTGASGFLGSALVARLKAAGREVVALARSAESAETVGRLGAEVVRGDVLDLEALVTAVRDCDVVFHLAGVNAFCLRNPEPMFRVNVDGSRTVVRAAAAADVGRVVYTSSAAVVGERAGTVGSEDSPHRGFFLSEYERSKHEAERAVREAALDAGVDVVYVNPASVQGPGRTGGTARLVLDYVNGRLKVIVRSRLSFVDIDDCVEGHLLAEARGEPGRRYLLCGATLATREAVALLADLSGIERRPRELPVAVAFAAAAAVEAAARLRGRTPKLCRELVRTLVHGHRYDGSRAERELGLRYTPPRESLLRTLTWYAENGYVSRPLPGIGRGVA